MARAAARDGDGGRADLARAVGAELLPAAARRRHRRAMCSPYVAEAVADEAARRRLPLVAGVRGSSPLRRELLRQSFATSLPELLRYADRDSMAHSREARLPFLDRRIAEFALSLPPRFLQRDGVRKAILRDAVRGIVPQVVLDRRDKVGFEPPQAAWLRDEAVFSRMSEVILDRSARGASLYDRAALEADVRAREWRDPRGAWRVFNLELWLGSLVRDRVPAAAAG
jgi:asparagine synthase (glutamine-hydrolysing)